MNTPEKKAINYHAIFNKKSQLADIKVSIVWLLSS